MSLARAHGEGLQALRPTAQPTTSSICAASSQRFAAHAASDAATITAHDVGLLRRAAELARSSCGQTQPHPNAACILTDASGAVIAEAFLLAQGTEAPEVAATRAANGAAIGGTAYLNLETGDCPGDTAGIQELITSGISRVIIGLRHPLSTQRGVAISALCQAGITVNVLGEAQCSANEDDAEAALDEVLLANEPLLHRAVLGRPMGILKYAMTLDGKIAASSGHSAWVSSAASRQVVFDTRARCDAVIVGGQTVRRDDPRLTTRQEGGHQPIRVVMSRTLDLPAEAALWDVSHAPTVVATQRGVRGEFQRFLRQRGVEVVEFDFLTPDALAEYFYARGFLSLLWECGGTLAAPAIAGGAIHKTIAFIAPKIIGGTRAPTPVGDLGFVEMTQALAVSCPTWQQVGPDLMLTGYLPRSQGPRALAALLDRRGGGGHIHQTSINNNNRNNNNNSSSGSGASSRNATHSNNGSSSSNGGGSVPVVEFYKSWDKHGALSNFTAHQIAMPSGAMTDDRLQTFKPLDTTSTAANSLPEGWRYWPSVEHYYQAQKFAGVSHSDALGLIEEIATAESPEQAAALGRRAERCRPELMREDWGSSKAAAMHAALRAKFSMHPGPRELLLSTAGGGGGNSGSAAAAMLVEAAPHDFFWGRGIDGSGQNTLGKLLVAVREELLSLSLQSGGGAQPLQTARQ